MSDLHRHKTGVEGLDKMLNGGLIPERPYIVCGPPGAGKTTLCLQFLLEGIRNDEEVLLVALDEPPNEIKSNAESFKWNLDKVKILDATPDISTHKRVHSIIDVGTVLDVKDMKDIADIRESQSLRVREVSVYSVQKMLAQEFYNLLEKKKKRYTRIVVDSLTGLKLFSMKGEDWKKHIQSFFRFLSELEMTTLIVSEEPKDVIESEFILSRGEFRLYRWHDEEKDEVLRAISIEKMRGTPFDERVMSLCINDKGLMVGDEPVRLFKVRKREARKREAPARAEQRADGRVRFGIKNLDAMLNGGLLPRRPYIVSGPPGSGKTTLCMQFLLRGLYNNERGLYVAIEEPPNEVKMNMESVGWNVDEVDVFDANSDIRKPEPTPILEISSDSLIHRMGDLTDGIRKSNELKSFEVTIHSLQQRLKQELVRKRFQRLVIDSVTAMEYFCMEDFEIHAGIHSFLRFLSEMKITTLLTVELPETGKVGFESMFARGEIRLHKYRDGENLKRAISVEKYRGSAHDENVHPLEITKKGIEVG